MFRSMEKHCFIRGLNIATVPSSSSVMLRTSIGHTTARARWSRATTTLTSGEGDLTRRGELCPQRRSLARAALAGALMPRKLRCVRRTKLRQRLEGVAFCFGRVRICPDHGRACGGAC